MTHWTMLPPEILAEIHDEARERQVNFRASTIRNAHGLGARDPARDLQIEIQGRSAEYALAQELGITLTRNTAAAALHHGDVGPYEVRSTTHPDGGLILRPEDPDHRICYLVIVEQSEPPRFGIVGSIRIRDGKRSYWWRVVANRPGAWIVPQYALEPWPEPPEPVIACGICPGVMLSGQSPPHAACAAYGWRPGELVYGPK